MKIRLMIRMRAVAAVVSMGLLLASALPATALAAGSVCAKAPVGAGLWQGFGMAMGMRHGCVAAASGSSAAATLQSNTYAALGDSVAAGLGLPVNDSSDPACGVSAQAYPTVVATTRGLTLNNVACSGATAGDLLTEQHLSNTARDIEPQLPRAFAGGTPALLTITAGANDVQWNNYVYKCYVSTCGTTADRTASALLLAGLQVKLQADFTYIRIKSHHQPPKVVITGYYQPLAAACAQQQTQLTTAEISWLNAQAQAISQTIASVARQYSFVTYVPVSFAGHELCTANPWVQGPNDAAPFHPTAQGQRAIAQAVLAAL